MQLLLRSFKDAFSHFRSNTFYSVYPKAAWSFVNSTLHVLGDCQGRTRPSGPTQVAAVAKLVGALHATSPADIGLRPV